MIYCMFKILSGESLKFEGVASSETVARQAIKDGSYLVCPIVMDRRYDENIASLGFKEAIVVKAILSDVTEQIASTLTSLDNLVRDVMIPQLQPLVNADLPGQISDLVSRVDALENP